MALAVGGVEPELLESGVCSELDEGGPTPVGVPAIESGSSLNDGTWEWGEGVAAADDSMDGGVPTELDGLLAAAVADEVVVLAVVVVGIVVGFGVVAILLGLMVGEDVEDNWPPVATADDAGLLMLVAGSVEDGPDGVLFVWWSDGLWTGAALVTGTVVAAELEAAATTAPDDSPEMAAVAAVVSVNEGDEGRGEWLWW